MDKTVFLQGIQLSNLLCEATMMVAAIEKGMTVQKLKITRH